MATNPRYFFVAFGSEHIQQPVEGGRYRHGKGYIQGSGISAGDVMILYCTGGYPAHDQEAPGVGVVTSIELVDNLGAINYQYFPLDSPMSWETIKTTITELTPKVRNFGRKGNWLRPIDNSSFSAAMADRQISWP